MEWRSSQGILGMVLACGLIHAQTRAARQSDIGITGNPEIRGVVLEAGTKQPVAGAEVSLYLLGEERPTVRYGIGSLTSSGTTQTDGAGAFAFHPAKLGYYTVAAKREGYVAPSRGEGKNITDVTLTAAEPVGEARLTLSLPGQITGTVVDKDTEKPIADLTVYAGHVQRRFGRLTDSNVSAKTNSDGRFVIANLTPGEYVVKILAQRMGRERIIPKFSDADLKAVDEDYEPSYWPGGGRGLESVAPLTVGSGGSVDFGTVRARKVPYYRLHVRIPPGPCGPEDKVLIYEQVPFRKSTIGRTACAPDLLVAGFPPGSYRLLLTMVKDAVETRETASIPFVIKDENVEITAPLEPGATVNATLIASEGAKTPDFSKMRVTFNPVNALPIGDLVMPKAVDSSGKAQWPGVPLGNHRIYVGGLGAGAYVKEMRYNGQPFHDQILPLAAAISQDLTILIDDKPAAITGAVMDGEKPVAEPHVILAKWPLPVTDSSDLPLRITGDAKGRFGFTGLAPGEYRVLALRTRDEDDDRLPGTLERAFATARKVEVGLNAVQNVTIEVSTLR